MDRPVLQVALDMMNMDRALQIAQEAVAGGADWIEAGTPLIKSEGVEVLRELRKLFPSHTILADLKTADVGGYEMEIVAKARADIMTVLGISTDGTITEAVAAGQKYGCKVMVDLLGVEDKLTRAKQVEALGAHYLNIHIPIDEQMTGGGAPLEYIEKLLAELNQAVNLPIAVAGGLTAESAPRIAKAGASIIIVGGAIIKSEDVTGATQTIRTAIDSGKASEMAHFKRYGSDELREAFDRVSTPNVTDAMHRKGAMFGITGRTGPGTRAVGPALTVSTANGDWAKPVEAIEKAEPGSMIVIDAGGGDIGLWGELASWSCSTKGISGTIIDGAARDIDEIRALKYPLWSRHAVPNAGEPTGRGEIGPEIRCGGQTVRTGDWIIADDSGVVVVPQNRAVEVANRALDILEKENRLREEIKRGKTLSDVLSLERWERVG